jgi:hypothetical protein
MQIADRPAAPDPPVAAVAPPEAVTPAADSFEAFFRGYRAAAAARSGRRLRTRPRPRRCCRGPDIRLGALGAATAHGQRAWLFVQGRPDPRTQAKAPADLARDAGLDRPSSRTWPAGRDGRPVAATAAGRRAGARIRIRATRGSRPDRHQADRWPRAAAVSGRLPNGMPVALLAFTSVCRGRSPPA